MTTDLMGEREDTEDVREASARAALTRFFTPERWRPVCAILNGAGNGVSLRLLERLGDADFHRACEAEGVPLMWWVSDPLFGTKRVFNLAVELRATQSLRRKKRMEAFARRNAALKDGGLFEFGYGEERARTNVAQLEFFRYLLQNCVLEWLDAYRDGVERARARSPT